MTTKEFIRRRASFSILDSCPYLILGFIERCFKITLITRFKETQVVFSEFLDFDLLASDLLSQADSVYFEFYSFDHFIIDIGYFKSFFNRLSDYQKKSLLSFHLVDNLLRYINAY